MEQGMPKKIINNLEEFAVELINFISKDGIKDETIAEIFKKTKLEYTKYKGYYFLNAFYRYTRRREVDFEKTISDLELTVDPMERLEIFLAFIIEGGWEKTSANTELYTLLINSIKGYEKEDDLFLQQTIIPHLHEITKTSIQNILAQQRVVSKIMMERERELQGLREGKIKNLENISLIDDQERAQATGKAYPEKKVFFLSKNEPGEKKSTWKLTWYDLLGEATSLPIEGELKNLLAKTEKLPEDDAVAALKIKAQCNQLLEELLARINVVVSLSGTGIKDLHSTYLVTLQDLKPALFWFNSLGQKKPISLKDYPNLQTWFSEQESFLTLDLLTLKSYLRHIKTSDPVDSYKQAQVAGVLEKRHGITLIPTDNLKTLAPYRRIPGTYFLTREPFEKTGEWSLYYCQKGKDGTTKICTDDWEQFHTVLNQYDKLSPTQLSITNINKIRETISEEISKKKKETRFFSATSEELTSAVFPPFSYVVSKKESWELWYIDSLQRKIPINSRMISDTTRRLFATWDCTAQSLDKRQLFELSKTLKDYNPPSFKLNLNDYLSLSLALGKRSVSKKIQTTEETGEKIIEPQEESTEKKLVLKKPGRIKVSDYPVATLFGHVSDEPKMTANKESGCQL